MIEGTIIGLLEVDPTLIAYVTKYDSSPAMFSDDAPEDAKEPYIVVEIQRNNDGTDIILQEMDVFVDIYHLAASKKELREASERCEFILAGKNIDTDPRYSSIRIWLGTGGPIQERDPREGRNEVLFYVRACRKKFIEQLT